MKHLYYGGTLLTLEDTPMPEAMLCDGGRITALGDFEELRRQAPDAQLIPLEGATLMPAFVDAHSHFSQVAMGMNHLRLNGAASFAEIRARFAEALQSRALHPGEWIVAEGYDHNLLPDGKHLTLAQLDELSPEQPLSIQHQSGHMGLFNSLALRALGVTADTPDPEGGRIGKTDGKLNGYLEENAYVSAARKIPLPDAEGILALYADAQKYYAAHGVTTVQEGCAVSEMLPLYRLLLSKPMLNLDLVAYPDAAAFDAFRAAFPEPVPHFRIGGIKLILDGSPQGRTAWMRTPYVGGGSGYGAMSDEAVLAVLRKAGRERVQVLAHCNGDAAAAQMLRCLRLAEQEYPVLREMHPVMIHAQLLGRDQIAQARELGVIASFFVAHVYHWGDVHIRNFGMERAGSISPAASALAAGLPFTFHQDSPVVPPDMLETVSCAVNRVTRNGVTLGADEAIPVLEALKAVTLNAAAQYGERAEKGSLCPGKREDLVLLDRNPCAALPEELGGIRVLRTIKDGRTLFSV